MPVVCKKCGKPPIILSGFIGTDIWRIYCVSDSCLSSENKTYKSEKEAIEAWNSVNNVNCCYTDCCK